MKPTVLISGAGVAGLAAAYWLDRFGFRPTVVEQAPMFRGGGQAVDVRGVALDVLAGMGLLDAAHARRTRFTGMSMVDRYGEEKQRTLERTYSGGRLDSQDIEIFRDDLCALLRASCSNVEMWTGDSITALEQDRERVQATFAHSAPRSFDLVIGADGIHSNVRRLGMPGREDAVRQLGAVLALFTAPNLLGLENWEWAFREETLGLVTYPTLDNRELRVGVGFAGQTDAALREDLDAQKAWVKASTTELGGPLRQLIDALDDAPQFYLGDIAQVHLPRWSLGRIVLAGDAAHCASPFSGQGTSLALVGGFVLARELAAAIGDFERGLGEYERRMRPFVALNQALVDPTRQEPIPEEQMQQAKFGIALDDLRAA